MKIELYNKNEICSTIVNKIKIFIVKKNGYKEKFVNLTVKYGANDSQYYVGTAHFLEHVLLSGINNKNFYMFNKYGANFNAYTSFNNTSFHFSCSENFYENLQILIDLIFNPKFNNEVIESERKIIKNEINLDNEDASAIVFLKALDSMYENYSVEKSILGNEKSIININEEILKDTYNNHYINENMIITIIGDVNIDDTINMLNKIIPTSLKNNSIREKKVDNIEYVDKKTIVQYKNLELNFPRFIITFKKKIQEFDLLKDILINEIIEKIIFFSGGIIHESLYNFNLIKDDMYCKYYIEENFNFYMLEGNSKDPILVKDLLIQLLKDIEFRDEDVFRTKKTIWGEFITRNDDIELLGTYVDDCLRKNIDPFKCYEVLKSISLEDINNLFKSLYNEESCNISIVGQS